MKDTYSTEQRADKHRDLHNSTGVSTRKQKNYKSLTETVYTLKIRNSTEQILITQTIHNSTGVGQL